MQSEIEAISRVLSSLSIGFQYKNGFFDIDRATFSFGFHIYVYGNAATIYYEFFLGAFGGAPRASKHIKYDPIFNGFGNSQLFESKMKNDLLGFQMKEILK